MRAILMASAAIFIVGSATGMAADLAPVRTHASTYRQHVAFECPPVPGGVLYGRIDRWRRKAQECHFDDWQDRPGIDTAAQAAITKATSDITAGGTVTQADNDAMVAAIAALAQALPSL